MIFILFLLLFGVHAVFGNADDFDWPRWRGPNGDGISKETDWGTVLLDISSKEPKVLLKSMNMDSYISSPVLVDGYIYGVHGGPQRTFNPGFDTSKN